MALKYLLDEASYAALAEGLKSEYKKEGDGYIIDLIGAPKVEDVTGLKNTVTNTKRERDELKTKLDALETELDTARAAIGDKTAERTALDASWQGKIDRVQADYAAKEAKLSKAIENLTVGMTAKDISAISTIPSVFEEIVKKRLVVDNSGDEPVVRVLDKDGKPSALTIEELKKELAETPEFKPIIKASSASGGGAGGAGQGGGATGKKISEMTLAERTQTLTDIGEAEFTRRAQAGL